MSDCVFCDILASKLPSSIVIQDDLCVAFMDIQPVNPGHVLVIPKSEQYRDVTELAAGDPGLMAKMVAAAKQIAVDHANGEYRLIFNNGASVAQSVFHVHAHVLGNLEENKLVGF